MIFEKNLKPFHELLRFLKLICDLNCRKLEAAAKTMSKSFFIQS